MEKFLNNFKNHWKR